MKLMQFLMGLDDSYMQIRSNILSRDPLPDVRGAYVIISSEESHRVVSSSNVGTSQRSQSSMFNTSVNNKGFTQRTPTSGNSSRPNNVTRSSGGSNRRTNGGPQLVCEHCGFNGYTIGRCFKLIGYPADIGKRNNNNNSQGTQNFNRRFINNNSVGSSSSSTFFDDQLSKIISLIKDNSLNNGKGVQANMAAGIIVDSGANQHLTYTDKYLVNVINISNLGIKVSHPNGTEAVITNVGNMVLTKNLTLYDVLVVPEYCVSLMSVHKIAKDSGLIVAFNENKCFVLPQDLREMKILGTGNQIDGLYYFNNEIQEVKGWLDEDLEYYHLKELHYSAQCHTQMSLWIISRGVVLLILLMEYKVLRDSLLHRGSLLALKCLVWFMKYYANVRRTVADFSHAPLNEYSPSPDDKKQWSLGCWFGGKPIQKLRQKGVYEESFSRHAAWIGGKLIQLMHTKMVQEQVKTMKIQAGIQVLRRGELRRQLQLWKRFGRLYYVVICTC
ncbi:hypothetical protein Tco_0273953 [Tanacetum coccineum]